MSQQILVAIIAGLLSALLYGSVLTGSPLSIILFYMSSLPLFVAGMGWGWLTGAIGAAAATIALGVVGGLIPAGVFLLAIGAPAAILSRLALQSRPGPAPGETEWYPAGRVIAAAALIGAALILPSLASFGFSLENMHVAIRNMFDRMLAASGQPMGLPEAGSLDTEALAALFVRLMPAMSVVIWIATTMISMYLAGRILRASGRLRRPWPDLHMIELPRTVSFGVALALLAALTPGIFGLAASAVAAALIFAQMLVGLAVMHVVTKPSPVRILILGGVYFVLLFLGWSPTLISWPGMILAILGLLEPNLRLRERVLARMNQPPSPPPARPPGGV